MSLLKRRDLLAGVSGLVFFDFFTFSVGKTQTSAKQKKEVNNEYL